MHNKPTYKELELKIKELERRTSTSTNSIFNNENIYFSLFENSIIYSVITNKAGQIIKINNSMKNMLGYSDHELSKLNINDIYVNTNDRNTLLQILDKKGGVENFETQISNKQDTICWINLKVKTIRHDGEMYLLASAVNITKQKKTEEKLAQSKEFLNCVINAIPDPIFVKNDQHSWIEVNDALCKMVKHTHQELIGKTDYDIFPKEQSDIFWEHDEIVMKSNKPDINEENISTPDGLLTISTHKMSFINPITHRKNLVGTIRDITKQKQTEDNLINSQRKLKDHVSFLKILNNFSQAIQPAKDVEKMLWDAVETTLSIFSCDRCWLLYPCATDAPFVKVPIEATTPEYPGAEDLDLSIETSPAIIQDITDALSSNQPMTYGAGNDKPLSEPSNNPYSIKSQIFMSISPNVGSPWMFGMHQCSTERVWTKQERHLFSEIGRRITENLNNMLYQKQLLQSEKKLQRSQKMETVGVLAGGIAHEFNNLLYIISGNTELLLKNSNSNSNSNSNEILHEILDTTNRGSDLVKQLLAFSRKSETNLFTTDLNIETKNTSKMLDQILPRMISLKLNLAKNLPPIKADHGQIEQVILNICLNARDAMPDGGTITITTESSVTGISFSDTQPEQLQKLINNGCVVMTITDTGCGIPSDTIEHIFDPFFTTKDLGKGTGLGLSVIYGIIKGHGGYITCNSELGEGAIFKIYFPTTEDDETDKTILTDIDTPKEPAIGSGIILLIDDEEPILKMTSTTLEILGYSSITASSGELALDLYLEKQNEIELVILDLSMPGMGGKKCLEKLIEVNPNIKVIIASGYAGNEMIGDMKNNGAKDFIVKPYSIDDLSSVIQNVLNTHNK